jgi:hypothetical protein
MQYWAKIYEVHFIILQLFTYIYTEDERDDLLARLKALEAEKFEAVESVHFVRYEQVFNVNFCIV